MEYLATRIKNRPDDKPRIYAYTDKDEVLEKIRHEHYWMESLEGLEIKEVGEDVARRSMYWNGALTQACIQRRRLIDILEEDNDFNDKETFRKMIEDGWFSSEDYPLNKDQGSFSLGPIVKE